MSKGVNKWLGIGNCCDDPVVRYSPDSKAIANVTIACNDGYKDKNTGQMVDKTEFVRVVFFRRLAEIVGEYCRKGSKIYIEGKLQTRKYQDKAGVDRYITEIVAENMQMLDGRGDSKATTQPREAHNPPPGQPAQDDFSDDIPFMRMSSHPAI